MPGWKGPQASSLSLSVSLSVSLFLPASLLLPFLLLLLSLFLGEVVLDTVDLAMVSVTSDHMCANCDWRGQAFVPWAK